MINKSTMIEVFKTNVQKASEAKRLITLLIKHLPGRRINVDMHDCDKILRIEGENFAPAEVMLIVKNNGFTCCAL